MSTTQILVVDDDDGALRMIQIRLERAGLACDTATCGAEALARLRQLHYRVVITDYNMPEMNGIELARNIKEIAPLTQIIMLTADDAIATIADAMSSGACEYISKTDKHALMIDTTRQCLERAERWWRSFEKTITCTG